ncbi:hypothetical protein BDZ89DRAFT_1206543 [Hymenopellis radicata]|nr:hypothetical protein BDZ89DRAFT_1206543 [Hymenopellis radicata]
MSQPTTEGAQFLTLPNGQNFSRFGNGPWTPIVQHSDAAGNRIAANPSFNGQPFPTALQNGVHVPLTGPSDTPIMFQSVPGPSTVDPALMPLPNDKDDDFPPPHKIAASIAQPAAKIAGSRRSDPKGKGKQRARDSETPALQKPAIKRKRGGRTSGAANYTAEDMEALLDIVEIQLPIGGKGWNVCTEEFNIWAVENERPKREAKSLEKQVQAIERAHQIESLMNEKAHTRELNDSDIDDVQAESEIEILSDDFDADENPVPAKKAKVLKPKPVLIKSEPRTEFITRRSNAPRTSRPDAQNLLSSISSALDPAAQAARDDERSARSFQTTQYLALSNQLRDMQTQISQLQMQLMESERGRQAAEHRVALMEMKAELQGSNQRDWDNYPRRRRSPSPVYRRRRSPSPAPRRHSPPPSHHRRWRQDVYYPEGGRATYWISSDDDGCPLDATPSGGARIYFTR